MGELECKVFDNVFGDILHNSVLNALFCGETYREFHL